MPAKAALVTGAARRIGAAIARDLAANGWSVLLHYNSSLTEALALEQEITASGGTVHCLAADLSKPAEAAGLIDRALAAAPGLELLVNNASLFEYDNAATTAQRQLVENFTVNAIAPILLAQRFAEILPPGRTGSIVNLLDNRIFAPNPDYFSYGVSKFAALGATRMLALALAPRIRVNAIAPGITLPSGAQSEDDYAAAHRISPLGRGCTPAEIASAVRFIAGSPAMTGTIITIDGGLALANPGRDVAFLSPGKP